ncbi:MAG: tRNA pseudouridine(55) synthase TruB [Pseudomonadota bacterium]
MARRRKGRDISGWVIVDKPAGVGSTDVVGKVRWAFQAQKAGHAGTLDPAATGVLAVALGEATKVVPYVTDAHKAYQFTVRWGQATTTDDAEGEVIAHSATRPDAAAIEAALPEFRGQISQVPPRVSAVKVDGARAYDLAREDAEFELAARPLWVERLELTACPDADHSEFEMECGKGGYVRSIARDLGERLGCLGHVTNLRRVWSGPFEAEGALDYETLERDARTPALDAWLRPLEEGLADVLQVRCPPEGAARLRNGNPGLVLGATDVQYGDTAWASLEGRAVAIGIYRGGELHPKRVFNPA